MPAVGKLLQTMWQCGRADRAQVMVCLCHTAHIATTVNYCKSEVKQPYIRCAGLQSIQQMEGDTQLMPEGMVHHS